MKKCVACGQVQGGNTRYCVNCGSQNFVAVQQGKEKKNWLIVVIALAAAVVLAVGTFLLLFDPVSDFTDELRAGNYAKAMDILEKHIYDNPERRDEAFYQFGLWIDELYGQFEQQAVTYEELTVHLEELEQFGIYPNQIYRIYSDAEWLQYLRDTYSRAEQASASGDYLEAYNLYNEVADADFEKSREAVAKAEEAMEAYWDQIQAQIDGYLENHEYDRAYALLDEVYWQIPDDGRVSAAYDVCHTAQMGYEVDQMLESAAVYVQKQDYVGVLTYLDQCISQHPEESRLIEYRGQCVSEFEEYVITESLRLAREGEYHHALSLANAGTNYFSSVRVEELIMIYISHIPVILGEMEIFENDTEGGSWVTKTNETDKYLEDNYGNTYKHSLSVGCGALTYLVNFKYQTFRGTVAFPKGLESDGPRSSASLYIYGDGEKIAEFLDLDESSRPQTFELDISRFERIVLKWSCEGYNIWQDWGYFATIFEGEMIPIPLELPE